VPDLPPALSSPGPKLDPPPLYPPSIPRVADAVNPWSPGKQNGPDPMKKAVQGDRAHSPMDKPEIPPPADRLTDQKQTGLQAPKPTPLGLRWDDPLPKWPEQLPPYPGIDQPTAVKVTDFQTPIPVPPGSDWDEPLPEWPEQLPPDPGIDSPAATKRTGLQTPIPATPGSDWDEPPPEWPEQLPPGLGIDPQRVCQPQSRKAKISPERDAGEQPKPPTLGL